MEDERPRVLVSESFPAVGRLVELLLTRAGYRAKLTADPEFELATGPHGYAAAVLGRQASGEPAVAITGRLRAAGCRLPVLLLVGVSDPDAALTEADRAVATVRKPFSPAELIGALGDMLGRAGVTTGGRVDR